MDGEPTADQPPADMEAMGGMEDAMEAAMEGMDGMEAMDGIDGAMDGMEAMDAMGDAMDGMDGMDDADPDEMDMDAQMDYSNDQRMRLFIEHCAETLENFKEEEHWKGEHYNYVNDFLNNPDQKCIFMWSSFDEEKRLRVSNVSAPLFYEEGISKQDYQVAYFMKKKKHQGVPITISNIKDIILFKQIGTDPMEDLLEQMKPDFVKKLLGDNTWPDGVRKEFMSNLHQFMAFLNVSTYQARGQTYLYIPDEDISDDYAAAQDKDLLQRLESTVIQWTRQIKDLVSNQDSPSGHSDDSPLDEIAYWNKRTANLNVLIQRLQHKDLKQIIKVLNTANSSYLEQFQALEKKIQIGWEEAKDNLQFLNTLGEPCRKIEQAKPKDIPKILPEALNCVRIIFELSEHYNTSERMKSLLTKISNQIIKQCRAKINKDDMLSGDVEKCMEDLQESIDCCKQWKIICQHHQDMIKKYSPKTDQWDLHKDETIFAENEAFIQRCKDLMEICQGQLQFARKGAKQVMPKFGGVMGDTYAQNLYELEKEFARNIQNIKNLKYDILDVKKTQWHEDYGQLFKDQCKNLETKYHNNIALAFKNVSSVQDAVEMLENFDSLAKRPLVKDYVHKKAAEMVWQMFKDEMQEIGQTFEGHNKVQPPMPFSHPKHGGLAIWAQNLMVRVDRAQDAISNLHFIPVSQAAQEKYTKLKEQLDTFIANQCFQNWKDEIADFIEDNTKIDQKLEVAVLSWNQNRTQEMPPAVLQSGLFAKQKSSGLLESNFDHTLHKILAEVTYWQKISALGYCNIPHPVAKLYQRKDQLRLTRESVMLVVRDYNNIKGMINDQESSLFSEHLSLLDKTIEPGIRRHNWSSSIDTFVYNSRRECQEVFINVTKFQNNQQQILNEFEKISSTCITNIQKTIYLLSSFVSQQDEILETRRKDLQVSFNKIITLVMSTYDLFIKRKHKIQNEWLKFIYRIDDGLLKSLQNSVQITLLDLAKRINGDSLRQELIPIFKIFTILDPKNEASWNIIHEPSHDDLLTSINLFIQRIIQVTNVVPRIEKIFRQRRTAIIMDYKSRVEATEKEGKNLTTLFVEAGIEPSVNYPNKSPEEKELFWQDKLQLPRNMDDKPEYVDRIIKKSKIKHKKQEITEGVERIQTNMDEDRKRWQASEERRFLSNMRTERGWRRILRGASDEDGEDPVQRYKESIESINEIVIDVNNKPGQQAEGFIIIDCSLLKNKLQEYGQEFISKIVNHLVEESKTDLNSMLQEFEDTAGELMQPVNGYHHLKKNKDLMQEVLAKLPQMGLKRDPIKKKFQYIQDLIDNNEGNNIELTPEEKLKLEGIDDAWVKFNEDLDKAKTIINRFHQQLKTEVDNSIEEFKKECQDNKKNFQLNAPYQVDKNIDNTAAFARIQEYKTLTEEYREKEEDMKFSLEIFDIEPIAYPELTIVEREIDLLTQIWTVKDNWDKSWDQWKEIPFHEADFNNLQEEALDFKDEIEKKIHKDVREWGVYNTQRQQITQFYETCNLLGLLQTEAMRERHWKELRFEVKADFDETGEDFNIDKTFTLGLLGHQEKIYELVDNAKKQLRIEVDLNKIEQMWDHNKDSDLDIAEAKSKADNESYYYIRSTDVIMEIIEKHGTDLGSMKSSPYYKEFDTKIDYWEATISQITETLEILLQVYSKWKYLESIFKGQPDISKQLPNEDAIFRRNHVQFKDEMERISRDKNCKRALTEKKNFLQDLYDLNEQFERIQKYLKQFLESKRSQFPRFYFLSDEDLLEIIGQSKDPKPILQHIRKMFEGVHDLGIMETSGGGARGQKGYEIQKLVNDDEEFVELCQPIQVSNKVEGWLNKLIELMRESLKKCFYQYHAKASTIKKALERDRLLDSIEKQQGQLLLTYSQYQWTDDVKKALMAFEQQDSNSQIRACKKKYLKRVDSYVELIEKSLGSRKTAKNTRNKIVSLIIIDQHNYEIVCQIVDKKVKSHTSFEWQQQLRFRKASDEGEKFIIECEQLSCVQNYGYEYQGNNGRLVVTPLTDRAYMTLTYALNLYRGGAPQGPAGTGKTETVKDLGKNLAFYVVIQNCSDQMDVLSLAKIFAGLALSGAWGCFDEFNRIEVEVLSVVAQQVQTILDAIKKKEASTVFGDMNIKVEKTTGLFITMNPGYAGRSELPDNLACLFRPVAMMKPDLIAIVMITLKSEGFKQSEMLSKKVVTIYELMAKQLSKQSHYDYGMRAIKSVLNASGRIKRDNKDMDETTVIIKALRDMNLPKFLADDVILFDNLFIDLFPDCEEAENDNDDLQIAIEEALIRKNLQLNENIVVKVMQLYESKCTRHGNMLVGATMSGKTTVWQILMDALNQLNQEEKERGVKPDEYKYKAVKPEVINPKSISCDELFGCLNDAQPPEWQDGILSQVLKVICKEKIEHRWMVLDGPIDTLWIETLNSVLDDNKLLTLTNGDRIALTPQVRMLFEVENLDVASPATVSRAGMIYLDIDELGWEPFMTMWIEGKSSEGAEMQELLTGFVAKYIDKVFEVKRLHCTELVKTSNSACIVSLTKLFDALKIHMKRAPEEDTTSYHQFIEKWFVFCLIWSIGCTVDEESRKQIDIILRDIESMFPHTHSVFEYYLHPEKRDWASWEEKLQANWKPNTNEFNKINVPTVDTTRNRFIVQALLEFGSQVLLVGHSGVGKTVLIDSILNTMDQNVAYFTINFSAGTTSNGTQDIIENNFERKAKNKYKPKNAKIKSVCFIDDLNMPRKDTFGSQPPLELMRQWIDYEFWYNRLKIEKNYIQDLQFLSAMGKPGGGRAEISNRILSKFHLINFTVPSEVNMKRIYETIAQHKFVAFDQEVKDQSENLAMATISIFFLVQREFLPTPAKSHYVFNMRDVSKVFQGIYMADPRFYSTKDAIVKLWAHELLRVFSDRLISYEDQALFKQHVNDQVGNIFQLTSYEENCTTNGEDPVFVDFLNDQADVYIEVEDFAALRNSLNEKLEAYNRLPKEISMNLVLFKDAITHICKIYRVLSMKQGHCFLVGVGGSGRHSLTRLAAFIQEMNVSQIEITKGYNLKSFRENIKEMYQLAGFKGRKTLNTVFIFSDNDIVKESFLEDIQNMLNGGVVPNIYTNDEMQQLRDALKRPFKRMVGGVETPENLDAFFFGNVKDYMHLSICFSPIGQAFKDYCKQYPALINNTTIDWFMSWPEEALYEVAKKFLDQMSDLNNKEEGLAALCAFAHSTTKDNADVMKQELNRIFYVTPTNYLELLKGYNIILKDKRTLIDKQRMKLSSGLNKLDEASKQVQEMGKTADVQRVEVSRQKKDCDDLIDKIGRERKEAEVQQVNIEEQTVKINKEKEESMKYADEVAADLKKTEPALIAAQQAIDKLDKKYIAEIKAFTTPPPDVQTTMSAVMILLQKDATWASAKKELSDSSFIKKIMEFDKDNIPAKVLTKIEKYTKMENFQPALVEKCNVAAGALCMWVRSLEDYSKALKIVAPKRARLQRTMDQLAQKEAQLKELTDEFDALMAKLQQLEDEYNKTQAEMDQLVKNLAKIQLMIDRGEQLVNGLSGEKTRWEAQILDLNEQYVKLIGDSILAAAFMSYCGPFPSEYRDQLISSWINMVENHEIPHTRSFTFSDFSADPAVQRQWQTAGLPTDKFSVENGCFVTKGLRWALNIDPQTQAMNWIKNTYKDSKQGIIIADTKDPKHVAKIVMGVKQGYKVLFVDVQETIDPILDNILNKSLIQVGKNLCVKVGDDEIEYDDNFKLYITTRMPNPHYTPEISAKVAIVNFTVKESGLEEQCVGIVVGNVNKQLEKQKNDVITKIADNKQLIRDLEDTILQMLQEANEDILEDVKLIETLNQSKEKADDVKVTLEQAEIILKKVDDTREQYRHCGRQASILYFVLNDLNKINSMYQFSLDWYKKLFDRSIKEVEAQAVGGDKIEAITEWHKKQVYKEACKALFEKHKLLLSMQMCIKLQMAAGLINQDEWNFFLIGGQVLDRSTQPIKPQLDWITQTAWDNITELEKSIPEHFQGFANGVNSDNLNWKRWFHAVKPTPPEKTALPGEWDSKCEDKLKKMIVLRCFRVDRVNYAIRDYVETFMKKDFVENPPGQLRDVIEDSDAKTPLIIVLSPGVDPTEQLKKLAGEKGIQFEAISMGKGQAQKAEKILAEGAEAGNWIFLANCHLSISMLPDLEGKIDELFKHDVDPNFRLILSANPHPNFSISLLQRSIKFTQEPPKGIKANMLRLYGQKTEFTKVEKSREFRKAVYGLCFFHTLLIERKKFQSLGWNVNYSFNESDYSVCEDILAIYMGQQNEEGRPIDESFDKKNPIPWPAIQSLIADCNYGGRITDNMDRRLIGVYAKEIFNDSLVTIDKWKPNNTDDTMNYMYPFDEAAFKHPDLTQVFTPQYFYEELMNKMDDLDPPQVYGQHINAEISSQINDSQAMLASILAITPQKGSGQSGGGSGGIVKLIRELRDKVPELIDYYKLKMKLRGDENPLNVVLLQEVARYAILLKQLAKQLVQLERGSLGLEVISQEGEEILECLQQNKVPGAWSYAYFSLKPLANWFQDLNDRYEFFQKWAAKGIPLHFWIGAFTYPTGFTTSVLQKFSRYSRSGAPIDKLEFDFIPINKLPHEITEPPKDGAYITKLYIEGGAWDHERHCLCEPDVMRLAVPLPVMHFKPIQKRAKPPLNTYKCPTYYYPIRQGSVAMDSFMLDVDLKSGDQSPDFWVLRGTALLMSLAT